MMQIEDMGFCPKGEVGSFVEGDTLFHDVGKLPFNTHGGLLSHAYVLGIAHVVECVKQVRGVASAQVPNCEVAVYGGYTGHMASTLVLTRDR
jgi:acetyl-CoA acetyltransferase